MNKMFRFLANGFIWRRVVTPQQVPLRETHAITKAIEKKLGLPEKPKRPISGYLRFYVDVHKTVRESHPKLSKYEVCRHVSEMWSSISDARKKEYSKEFNGRILSHTHNPISVFEYMAQMREYKQKLSDDEKKLIKELKDKHYKRRTARVKLWKGHELGRPKRPMNPFLKFLGERLRRQYVEKPGQTKAEINQFVHDIAIVWRGLNDAERAKYDSSTELEVYKNAVYEWEAEMIRSGRSDVITRRPVVPMVRSKSEKNTKILED